MFSIQPLVLPWLALATAAAAFPRRENVKIVAPFFNSTLTTTSTPTTSTSLSRELLYTAKSQEASDLTDPSTSKKEDAQTVDSDSALLLSTIVHDANNTVSSEVSITPTTELPSTVFISGSSYANTTSTALRQLSNASCTVNIPSASVDFWYRPTYSFAVGTITRAKMVSNFSSTEFLTLLPQTTTFDISSALETDDVCYTSLSYAFAEDWTYTWCEDYTEMPTATITSIAYRSAYSPFPINGTAPVTDAFLYDLYMFDRPSATTTLSVAPDAVQTMTSATPFVHFTAYEIESGNRTETIQLQSAFVFPYEMKGVEHQVAATGPLPEGFLNQITQSACVPGQLQAVITVVIVVDLYYQNWPSANPLIIHFESTVFGFDDPPVAIKEGSSKVVPFTVPDWDLSGIATKPTPASVKPQDRPDPVPTTTGRDSGSDNGNSFSPSPVQPPPILTIGSSTLTPNAATQYFIAPGQTLSPGGVVNIDGTIVSLAPSASFVVVGGSTQVLLPMGRDKIPAATIRPHIVVDGTTIVAQPLLQPADVVDEPTSFTDHSIENGPTFVVSDQTLAPGGPAITVSGSILSLGPSGSFVVINGITSAIAAPILLPLTIDGNVFTATTGPSGDSFIVAGEILAPGGSAITISGSTISLAPSASLIVINGATSNLQNLTAAQITAPPPLTIGDRVFKPLPGTDTKYIIFSRLLTPGGSVVVAGATISLALGATALIVNGATSSIAPPPFQPILTNAPLLTIGSQTYTAASGTTYLIHGQTLTPGGIITVDGTTIRLAAHATELIYASSGRSTSLPLFPATATQSQRVTRSLHPSAGASRVVGQATPTTQRVGAAHQSRSSNVWMVGIMGFAASLCAV